MFTTADTVQFLIFFALVAVAVALVLRAHKTHTGIAQLPMLWVAYICFMLALISIKVDAAFISRQFFS